MYMLYKYMLNFKWIIIINFSHISEHSYQINKMPIPISPNEDKVK